LNIFLSTPIFAAVALFVSHVCLEAHEGTHDSLTRNEKALRENPDSSALYFSRAGLLLEHGDPDAALAALDLAAEHGASADVCAMLRAKALLALKRPLEAAELLGAVLRAHPDHVPALSLRARAYAEGGKSEQAVADCRRALVLRADPDTAFLAADLLVAGGKSGAAIGLLDSSFPVGARPASIDGRALEIEIAGGKWDAALARLDRRIANSKRPEVAMARKAELLEMAGRHDDSISAWKSLESRLASLAPSVRDSHAMSLLAEKARKALNFPKKTTL
jgi:tetratricopeptide (TPR) repeat protein